MGSAFSDVCGRSRKWQHYEVIVCLNKNMSHIICSDLTFLAKAGRVFFTVFVILSSTTNLPSGQCKTLRSSENSHDWFFEMPGATSPATDSYRCASYAYSKDGVNRGKTFITQFTANATATKAHHIILQKCKRPIKQPGKVWDCNHHATCNDQSHILWAWAKDAPPTLLPKDVAFKLAPDEYVVMQIHYKNPFNEPDHSGVTAKISSIQPKYYAGIYLLWRFNLNIPPNKPEVSGDMNCAWKQDIPLYIFAFRPHAHALGKRIIGMKTDKNTKESTIIADGDPQKPQAFYPLKDIINIQPGDSLFARCTYDSTGKNKYTNIGSTAGDEMCNLYLMFYTEADNADFFTCPGGQRSRNELSDVADKKIAELDNSIQISNSVQAKEPKSLSVPAKPLIGAPFQFDKKSIGDICGTTFDAFGNVVILHRGNHRWDANTFSLMGGGDTYAQDKNSPITNDTVVTVNSTGHIISSWGKDFFFLPHMITIDKENNVWITDVAMHQVFKFGPYGGPNKKPLVALGEKFVPGSDDLHYCKPPSVAVMSDARTFFVSDGYCNQRVIKYAHTISTEGYHSVHKIMSFGAKEIPNQPKWNPTVYNFRVPHALALVESKNLICVADRENGAVQCFDDSKGTFQFSVPVPATLNKVYSIDAAGTKVAVLGGPQSSSKSKLMIYDLESNSLAESNIDHLAADQQFVSNPHDVAMTDDGKKVIVANLNPAQIWLFSNEQKQKIESNRIGKTMTAVPAVPEAILENHIEDPAALPIKEESRAIVMKTAVPEETPLWKSFGLMVVFVTGVAMIFYYVRIRRRKNQGFQPLKTEDNEL